MGHVGWGRVGGSCRGGVDHVGVGWVMQGWGWSCSGGVGHVGMGWGGVGHIGWNGMGHSGWVGHAGVGGYAGME